MSEPEEQTGFVPVDYDWLMLRFTADEASRNPDLARELAAYAAGRARGALRVLDLGAGAGANLLHLAPLLPVEQQRWTLIDRDQALAHRVRGCYASFARWLPEVEAGDQQVRVRGKEAGYRVQVGDFLDPGSPIYDEAPDVVVANAVFDLMSAAQLGRFLDLAAERWRAARPALYFTIHPDGDVLFRPADRDDARVIALYHAHMARPQAFGRAMGASCARELRQALEARGLRVAMGPSPLRLSGGDTALLHANLDFIESAARDMIAAGAGASADMLERWVARKRQLIDQGALALDMGFQDHWATWP